MSNKIQNDLIRYARSYLFTAAVDSRKFNKGVEVGADVSVFDLEDSVPLAGKIEARKNLSEFFYEKKPYVTAIRINNIRTLEGLEDLKFLVNLKFSPDIVFLPKINYPEEIKIVRDLFDSYHRNQIAIMGIIESSKAIVNVFEIAKASDGIIFGSLDFSVDCDIDPTWDSLRIVRAQMILAAGNAGVTCIDTAYFKIGDTPGLVEECDKLKQLGFRAKAAIHPSQVEAINKIFSPTQEEIDYANKVLKAYEDKIGGIKVLDASQMVGPPFILQARKVLKRANFKKHG